MKKLPKRLKLQLGAVILICLTLYVFLGVTFKKQSDPLFKREIVTMTTPRKLFELDPKFSGEVDRLDPTRNTVHMNLSVHLNNINEIKNAIKDTIQEIVSLAGLKKQRQHLSRVSDIKNSETEGKTSVSSSTNSNKIKAEQEKREHPIYKSFLTLFTTWHEKPGAENVYTNTLKNWASFKPALLPVLFTNNTELQIQALSAGWLAMNISKSEKGLPVLKQMFTDAMESVESAFYGYANGDIIFDGGLLKTLLTLKYNQTIPVDTKPVLITGQRWNVLNVTKHEAKTQQNLTNTARRRGALFQSSAEDFFISNSIYPWASIPEVVVGALGYDNWLVLNARNQKHHVIDVTKSVTVVHQSLTDNPYLSHWKENANYNIELLQKLYQSELPWPRGFVDCINWYTVHDIDNVLIRNRVVPAFCY